MDRGAWQATVHGVTRVEHDLVTTPPPPPLDGVETTSSQRLYLLSRAQLPRILLTPAELVCRLVHPKDTNLALLITITSTQIPLSSYVEMYLTDTLICIK